MRTLIAVCVFAIVALSVAEARIVAFKAGGSDEKCHDKSGTCIAANKKCSGKFEKNLCSGGNSNQCCVPAGANTPCGNGGTCIDVNVKSCAKGTTPKLCPGGTNIQCCGHRAGGGGGGQTPTPTPPTPNPPTPTPPTPAPSSATGLPSFDSLWECYPHGEANEVKKHLGGQIDADWITNTCTIRISRALICANRPLQLPFKLSTGKDLLAVPGAPFRKTPKPMYSIRVKEFSEYARAKFGKPSLTFANTGDGGAIPAAFKGKSGLIMFDVRVWSDATGHFDLWDGETEQCAHECYFDKARNVALWIAP
jgi:hypothetical protein